MSYYLNNLYSGYLLALQDLKLEKSGNAINSEILYKFLNSSPNIEYLNLVGRFSYFKNLSIRLTKLDIDIVNIDNTIIDKLFNGHHFPKLKEFIVKSTKISRLEKKLFD